MISEKELHELIKDMGSDRIERTISFREDKLGEAVCTFSNDLPNHKRPSYLLIGIDDKTGKIAGLSITDKDLPEKEFSGDLITILKNIDDFVTTNIIKNKSKRQTGFRPTLLRFQLLHRQPSHQTYTQFKCTFIHIKSIGVNIRNNTPFFIARS